MAGSASENFFSSPMGLVSTISALVIAAVGAYDWHYLPYAGLAVLALASSQFLLKKGKLYCK